MKKKNYREMYALYFKEYRRMFRSVGLAVVALFLASSNLFASGGHSQVAGGTRTTESQLGNSQQSTKQVTGVIVDVNGEAVIGANVFEKGTSNGTITDFDGKFSLDVHNNASLVVSYVGYSDQEIAVSGKSVLNITLEEDSDLLDEVVVVGYGTMKKKDLTGAVSSVKMNSTTAQTNTTISHALAGKAAGLQVTQVSAQVGGGSTFNIRGAGSVGAGNAPLIIIDGFPVSSSGQLDSGNRYESGTTDNILGSINPNDIESIDILKDASSTAIYGARAGHGVIIITTKRGKTGKVNVNYSGNFSVQNMKNSFKMLNGQEYMYQTNRYYYEKWQKENGQGLYSEYITPNDFADPFCPIYTNDQILRAPTTDWLGEITRTGLMHQHNVSMNGGTESTRYMASLNYLSQDGIVKNNNLDRFNVKINLDQKISKYVKSGLSFTLSRSNYDNVPLGNGEHQNSGIITSAVAFDPTIPVYDADGNYSGNLLQPVLPNPVSLLEITDKTQNDRLLGLVYVEVEPIMGLLLKANFGIDRKNSKRKTYLPKTTIHGAGVNGKANISQSDNNDYLMDLTINYNKSIKKHRINVLGGYSYQRFDAEGLSAGNEDFIVDSFLFNNLGAGNFAKPSVGSWASIGSLSSYFARANYSWDDRYLITATMRADGSSNFTQDNRWGYFPSVSAAWRFSEEPFMEDISETIFTNGKLRVSWGQTGNYNVGLGSLDYYGTNPWYGSLFGGSQSVGIFVSQLGNPNLTWETTTELNLGLDLGFLNNRILISAEYYQRVISDLLVKEKDIPHYNEVVTIAANIGSTMSSGFEFTLNTQNIVRRNFRWTSDLTLSNYNDRWKERDPEWKPAAYEKAQDPIRGVYVYRSEGLMQLGDDAPIHQPTLLPGQVKLKDITEDGILDDKDKELIGVRDPQLIFGFNNQFTIKDFDLSIYMYGQIGKIPGSNSYYDAWGSYGSRIQLGQNVPVSFGEAWTSDNQETTRPSLLTSDYGTGDYFLEKVSFLRVRSITLGYTIPINKKVIQNMRVYADVNNPFVWTNWNGQDPETDTGTSSYPNVTTFSVGVDVTF